MTLSGTYQGEQCVAISWDAVTNVSYYSVAFGSSPGLIDTSTGKVSLFTSFVKLFLTAGSTYYFKIFAYDEDSVLLDTSNELTYATITNAPSEEDTPPLLYDTTIQSSTGLVNGSESGVEIHVNADAPFIFYTTNGVDDPDNGAIYNPEDPDEDDTTYIYDATHATPLGTAPIADLEERWGEYDGGDNDGEKNGIIQSFIPALEFHLKCDLLPPFSFNVASNVETIQKPFIFPPALLIDNVVSAPESLLVNQTINYINTMEFTQPGVWELIYSIDDGENWQEWTTPVVAELALVNGVPVFEYTVKVKLRKILDYAVESMEVLNSFVIAPLGS